jgi:hypothetical protein
MTLSARVCVVVTSSKQTELDVLCGLFCNAKVGAGLCPRTQKKKKLCTERRNALWGMFAAAAMRACTTGGRQRALGNV